MSNRLSQEKANAIAAEYLTNGLQKVKALLAVGYSNTYANNVGLKLFDNSLVKQSIARIQAKNKANTDITVKFIQDKHLAIFDLAIEKGDLSTANAALTGAGKTIGCYQDNLKTDNTTRQELNSIQQKELEDIAREAKLRLVNRAV